MNYQIPFNSFLKVGTLMLNKKPKKLVYFPQDVFTNIMGFCGESYEDKRDRLWKSIVIIRKENFGEEVDLNWMENQDPDTEWTQEALDLYKPITYISYHDKREDSRFADGIITYNWTNIDAEPSDFITKYSLTEYLEGYSNNCEADYSGGSTHKNIDWYGNPQARGRNASILRIKPDYIERWACATGLPWVKFEEHRRR